MRTRAAKTVGAEQQRRHERPAREALHVQVLGVVSAELRPKRAGLDLQVCRQAGRYQVSLFDLQTLQVGDSQEDRAFQVRIDGGLRRDLDLLHAEAFDRVGG